MRFVQNQQVTRRHEVQQRPGSRTFSALINMAGIIFNPGTGANLPHHFHVIPGALFKALGFKQASILTKVFESFFQLFFNIFQRFFHPMFFGHIMFGRINIQLFKFSQHLAGYWIHASDLFNFITKKADPKSFTFTIGR